MKMREGKTKEEEEELMNEFKAKEEANINLSLHKAKVKGIL